MVPGAPTEVGDEQLHKKLPDGKVDRPRILREGGGLLRYADAEGVRSQDLREETVAGESAAQQDQNRAPKRNRNHEKNQAPEHNPSLRGLRGIAPRVFGHGSAQGRRALRHHSEPRLPDREEGKSHITVYSPYIDFIWATYKFRRLIIL